MITSKEELKRYLEQDRLALHQTRKRPGLFGDRIWKWQIRLRKTEWYWYSGKHLKNPFSVKKRIVKKKLTEI